MTHMPAPVLAAALLCLSPFGAMPLQAAPSHANVAASIVEVRTSCDENGRCYETGDPDRYDRDPGERDDAPPLRERRYRDPDDRGPPPRDYGRAAPPPRDFDRDGPPRDMDRDAPPGPYRGDRRRDDDDE